MIRFSLLLLLAPLPSILSAEPLPISKSYWRSPAFLKEFNGSYRINANIEPVLSSEERGLLVKMQSPMSQGQRSETIRTLKSSPLLKSSPAIQFNLANVYSETDQLKEAITYYKQALREMPSFRRAHQNLAYAYYRNNEIEKAHEHLLEVVRLGGNDGSVHGLLGHTFLQKEQFEPALRSFREALLTQPESQEWQLGLAQALQALERAEEAFVLYQTLAKKDPENKPLRLQLALLHHDRGNTDKAVSILELLRRQNALAAPYQLLLGTLLIGQENIAIGAQTLKRVLSKEDFKQPDEALGAIQFCLSQGQRALALELHDLIKEADLTAAGLTRYRRLKALILFQETPNHPEGLAILQSLIKADPTDSHSLLLLGQQHVLAKKPHEALLVFDQAIHAEGSYSDSARLEKSQILVSLQRYPEAIKELETYLENEPEQDRVKDYLKAVKNLNSAYTANSESTS